MSTAEPSRGLLRHIFSPSGMVAMAAIYLLVGLVGHDPWRGDDSRYFGPILSMSRGEGWLVPTIVGQPFVEYPPLYYWLGALLAKLFSGLLPLHDGARLASAAFTAMIVIFLARAAGALFGAQSFAPAGLLALGTLGLVVHAHEMQPMLALAASTTIAYAGLAGLAKRPLAAGVEAGLGCGLAVLAGGLSGLWLTAPLLLLASVAPPGEDKAAERRGALVALAVAAAVAGPWLAALVLSTPDVAAHWWNAESSGFLPHPTGSADLIKLLQQLGWFLWPLWPIAGWALWHSRRKLNSFAWRLPLLALVLASVFIVFIADSPRPANLLPLIPATALLASAGAPTLRRGANNAFDWFGVMTFAVFAVLVWLAWSAMTSAWPPGLARQLVKLAPGFHMTNSPLLPIVGAALVLAWLGLVAKTPRSPYRAPLNWASGMTMLWCLAVTLLMPWFDHGKSYRPAARSLAKVVGTPVRGCIAGYNVSPSIETSFDYFAGIVVQPLEDSSSCSMLLVAIDRRAELPADFAKASQIWEYRRGGGRQLEILRLYRRN